ncbi:ESX secretion-associated protein EspG [Saccharopolyspora sp. CA-218241]|uniref:ESX secretion-associated protein EspG n=1 Tax=Saccharopolyspora sp. CA-218241 TaxID=3240027 RepID=UPI003D965067
MRCDAPGFRALLRERPVGADVTGFLLDDPMPGAGAAPGGARWRRVLAVLAEAAVFGFLRSADLRALVAVARGAAVRIRVRAAEVVADRVRPDAPWPALVGALPAAEPATGSEVTVPTALLAEAREVAAARTDAGADWLAYELTRRDVPADDARAIGAFLHGADRGAELSVGLRESGAVRRAPWRIEVRWGSAGRIAVVPESPSDTYSMVTPAGPYLLGRSLQRHLDDLWQRTGPLPR